MDGNTLIIDCRGCRQTQTLADQHCLKGVLRVMAGGTSNVREIVLDRDWQILYGKDVVEVLSKLADVVRFCNGINLERRFEDCATCPSNPRMVVSRVVEHLPRNAPELDTRNPRPSGGHARACEQCVRELRLDLDHVRRMLEQVEGAMSGLSRSRGDLH